MTPKIDDDVLDAAERAAARAGMTMSDWLRSAVHGAVHQEHVPEVTLEVDRERPRPSIHLSDDYLEEHLTPVSQVVEDGEFSRPPCADMHEELEHLRQMVQDYNQVIAPTIAALRHLPAQLRELSELASDVRSSAETAHRAAASVLPLERTLLRLLEETQAGDLDSRHDRRSGSFGRLLRGQN